MSGIFGNGPGFDAMLFEEWERDDLIDKILAASDDYTRDELRFESIVTLNNIAKEVL